MVLEAEKSKMKMPEELVSDGDVAQRGTSSSCLPPGGRGKATLHSLSYKVPHAFPTNSIHSTFSPHKATVIDSCDNVGGQGFSMQIFWEDIKHSDHSRILCFTLLSLLIFKALKTFLKPDECNRKFACFQRYSGRQNCLSVI